ncbi:hypothetical protein HC723_11720 [Vibrio sp. S11_S32]|uniref:hypothetical protein n=1 Tax=Vibrio sp. S11_S32 TaxID=2720225 RepID=UPI0016806CEC|nr:hypothetical protein [Vibrio sp. S11_S32]MBD1577100.1 hypothetical protein [Vibrio sp. S11_S32]
MKKTTALLLSALFLMPVTAMAKDNDTDITRERMGLEIVEIQLGKIIEHTETLKVYSDQDAKRKFNYQALERQLKTLQVQIRGYLDHPPEPTESPTFEDRG